MHCQDVFGRSVEYVKVLEVSGTVQSLNPASTRWGAMQKNTFLKKNTKIRSAGGSKADFGLDGRLENAARLEENSTADFLTVSPVKIFLEKGSFFVFREGDRLAGTVKVTTKDVSVDVKLGGCVVIVSNRGTTVKVFSDKVAVTDPANRKPGIKTRTVREGFQFTCGLSRPKGLTERMQYADYTGWQEWIKKLYERKDRLAELSVDKIIEQRL